MKINQHETAIAAYHAHTVSGNASAQRNRILSFIKSRRRKCGWSIGEIAHSMRLEKSTVSARLNELLHSGALVEFERRKDKCSGVEIRPVGIPAN